MFTLNNSKLYSSHKRARLGSESSGQSKKIRTEKVAGVVELNV